jgi:hypothetical protein
MGWPGELRVPEARYSSRSRWLRRSARFGSVLSTTAPEWLTSGKAELRNRHPVVPA